MWQVMKPWWWPLPLQAPRHDLELQAAAANRTRPSAEKELLTTLFALNNDTTKTHAHHAWQLVYSRHLQGLLATTRSEFKPLFELCSLDWPPTKEHTCYLMNRTALAFLADERESISIDEVLAKLCAEHGCDVETLDESGSDCNRKAIFIIISWLTMLFQIPARMAPDCLQIYLPSKVDGIRTKQSIDEARLPLDRVIRGFGAVLPTSLEVRSIVDSPSPSVIHATCLSIESLIRIGRIRIAWTDSLGCHLLFDPLSRILLLYRYPSICALNCIKSGGKSTFEAILRDCYLQDEEDTSILTLYNQEALLSYRILFGQSKASRRYFRKVERKKIMPAEGVVDPLLDLLCGCPLDASIKGLPADLWPSSCRDGNGQLLEYSSYTTSLDLPVLGPRLLKVQEFDQRHQPYRLRDLWRDRRTPLQWYAFWAVLIIGGATIILALCQLVVGLLQLGVTWP